MYERNIDANMHKPSDKGKVDRHDRNLYCPITIKDTIEWFPFSTIMEYTANILNSNKGLITSLLGLFRV